MLILLLFYIYNKINKRKEYLRNLNYTIYIENDDQTIYVNLFLSNWKTMLKNNNYNTLNLNNINYIDINFNYIPTTITNLILDTNFLSNATKKV